jgi:putative ABC transport system permease protein
MDLAESFTTAVGSLVTNKLRSILTMLGVIIGVAAVIALLSIGTGVSETISSQIQAVGSNLIVVVTDMDNSGGYQSLSVGDLAALNDPLNAPAVRTAAGAVQGTQQVLYEGADTRVTVLGVTANYFQVRNMNVELGRALTERDVDAQERVAVLGVSVVDDLFPTSELPTGQSVKINGIKYEVVGILKEVGGMPGFSADDQVLIPLTTAQARLYADRTRSGERAVQAIYVEAVSETRIDEAIGQVETVLRERHDLSYEDNDDFRTFSQAELLNIASIVTGTMTIFLGAIAGISLLVGGIGIMNIMLVSVTERTREIGIRKAVGALKRDILVQFLIESLVMSLLGGGIGILLGIGASNLIGSLSADLTPVVSVGSVMLSFGFAAAVGIVFGIYPAWRAARLRPIEALRYE